MSRSVVMLLPGLLCDEAVWAKQRLSLKNAHCVVPSFDGLATITEMARSVVEHAPAVRFSLVGHSMGGRVALEVMRMAPQRIERLALLDTGLDPLPSGDEGERERGNRMQLLALAQEQGMRVMGQKWARGMVHPKHLDRPVFKEILDMIERKTPKVFETQLKALLDRPDSRSVYATVRCPTLLLCGRQDAWSPLIRHEMMWELLPASQLVVVEDSGHMTPMEQPEAVSAALAHWLSQPPGDLHD